MLVCLNNLYFTNTSLTRCHAGNAAWAHILAKNQLLDNPVAIGGEIVFITDDTAIQNAFEFMEPFLKARSMKTSGFMFPATLAIIFVLFLYMMSRLLRPLVHIRNPFPHPATLYFIVCFYSFNRLKSTLRLGYKPLFNPEDSVNKSLEYYRDVPLL